MVGEKIDKMKMQELQFLRSKRSKWEGHRRLKAGLNERRCMGVFRSIGADRLPPVSSTKSFDRRVVGHAYALGSRS